MEDEEDTISLSGLQFEDDNMCDHRKEVSNSSSSSSSSRSSFEHDFLGFFSEERTYNTTLSPENIIFCGRIFSSDAGNRRSSVLVRSTSDSFRFKKTAYSWKPRTPRSKSLPSSSSSSWSSCKSKCMHMFMVGGFGSGNFRTTMDMSDIKSRQLRRQSTVKVDEESGGRRSGWWRVVDVLGCNGGYDHRDTMMVV